MFLMMNKMYLFLNYKFLKNNIFIFHLINNKIILKLLQLIIKVLHLVHYSPIATSSAKHDTAHSLRFAEVTTIVPFI